MKKNYLLTNLLGIIYSAFYYLLGILIVIVAFVGAYFIAKPIQNALLKSIFYIIGFITYIMVKKTIFKVAKAPSQLKQATVNNDQKLFRRLMRKNIGAVVFSTLIIFFIGLVVISNIENLDRVMALFLLSLLFIPALLSGFYLFLLNKNFKNHEEF